MDKLGIKTTLYDILGYGVPGVILVLGVYVSFLPENSIEIAKISQLKISLPFGILCSFSFYIAGYFVSSVSSFIFENSFMKEKIAEKFYSVDTTKYNTKSNQLFGMDYNKCGRAPYSYCEHNYPSIYETAFVFLTIYGFSRNSSTALLLVLPFIIYNHTINFFWIGLYIIVVLFLIHNYFRFKVYYSEQIASSLLLP